MHGNNRGGFPGHAKLLTAGRRCAGMLLRATLAQSIRRDRFRFVTPPVRADEPLASDPATFTLCRIATGSGFGVEIAGHL